MSNLFNGSVVRPWRIDPSFDRLFRDMDALFNGNVRRAVPRRSSSLPGLEVLESDDAILLTMTLPGTTQEDVELSVLDRELTLKVEGKNTVPEGFKAIHRERPAVNLWRKFSIPETLDAEKIDAEMKDGLLRVTIPKLPESKPRRIEIKVKG